jgi:hypothetical protein
MRFLPNVRRTARRTSNSRRVYHHIVTERGLELARESFDNPEDLLFRLVWDTAFWMAADYEFKNRIEELMARASHEWSEKTRMMIGEILKENPYMS